MSLLTSPVVASRVRQELFEWLSVVHSSKLMQDSVLALKQQAFSLATLGK
jgi:hypothetical protein